MSMSIKALVGAMALSLCAVSASAVTFNVTGISGVWQNAVDVNGNAVSGNGTTSIRWGGPATSAGQSGYDFSAPAVPLTMSEDDLFVLGQFNHLNFPVYPPSLDTAELAVSISGTADSTAFNFNTVFTFDHFETPNNASPCALPGTTNPCPDLVTALNPLDITEIVTVGGVDYTLEVAGFVLDPNNPDSFLDSFVTLEGKNNQAYIVARFTEPAAVPLPAAAWLLLSGLGGLMVVRRRKPA